MKRGLAAPWKERPTSYTLRNMRKLASPLLYLLLPVAIAITWAGIETGTDAVAKVPLPHKKAPLADMKPGQVRIYTTEWCSYCKQAKRYFKSKGIRYAEYNIEESSQARQDYQSLGGGGVPLILIGHRQGNKILSGFSIAGFEAQYRQ